MKNDNLLHKWFEGSISEEELAEFKARPEYSELLKIKEKTLNFEGPSFDKQEMLTNILSHKKSENLGAPDLDHNKKTIGLSWLKYAAAACILGLAGFFFLNYNQHIESYKLAHGERLEATLPDNSIYVLNAESSIRFNTKEWGKNRIVELEGEAFFKVEKGSKFIVKCPRGNVSVLGTQFNVYARDDVFTVACKEGSVNVSFNEKTQILKKDDVLRLNVDNSIDRWKSSAPSSWVDGLTKFRDVDLKQLVEELERQFEIKIQTNNIDMSEKISCNFQHEDLDKALKTSFGPLNLNYKIKGDKVILSK